MRNTLRFCAFSLVELLVVMAIISVLAAMLLPTLARTLDSARTMRCANQMRQIGFSLHQYANDSGDVIPIRGLPAGTPVWWVAMRPYLGSMFAVDYTKYGVSRKPGDENLAACPATDYAFQKYINPTIARGDINRIQYWEVINYDINVVLGYRNNHPLSGTWREAFRTARAKRPSLLVLLVEAGAHDGPISWKCSESGSRNWSVYYNPRHADVVNNIRLDGSLRPEPYSAPYTRCSGRVALLHLAWVAGLDRHCWYGWGYDMAYPNVAIPAN